MVKSCFNGRENIIDVCKNHCKIKHKQNQSKKHIFIFVGSDN